MARSRRPPTSRLTLWGPASPACHRRRRRFPCSHPARRRPTPLPLRQASIRRTSDRPDRPSLSALARSSLPNPSPRILSTDTSTFTGGVATLHLTSITPLATATGTLGNIIHHAGKIDNGARARRGNILTRHDHSSGSQPFVIRSRRRFSLISGNAIAAGTHVTGYLTGNGLTGTYTVDTPQLVATKQAMFVSGVLPGPANDLQTNNSSVTGTLGMSSWITDGGLNITGEPIILTATNTATTTGFSNWVINQTYTPAFTNDTALTASQTALVPGQQVFGPGITTPVSIAALGSSAGTYMLSNNANGSVGSSGSPVALNSTGIQDGPAVAPGRALTIRDQGVGITYPTTSISCSALGACTGVRRGIGLRHLRHFVARRDADDNPGADLTISWRPPGPRLLRLRIRRILSGYSAALSAGTVFNWNGQALNIPGSSGPLYVSVRAGNGPAYATMPSFIKMGLVFDWQGDAQLLGTLEPSRDRQQHRYRQLVLQRTLGAGYWQSNAFNALNTGPAIVETPVYAFTQIYPGDAFSELQGGVPISEASNVFAQLLTNAFGWTITVLNTEISGIGIAPQAMGNVVQNQTIAIGDGTTTVFCSASIYCGASSTPVGTVSPSGPLIFTDATQTGAAITALIDDGTGTSTPGNILTTSARSMGVLEPGMTLTDASGHITGSPTLVACTTGCGIVSGSYPAIQKWTISGSAQLVASETMRGDLGATPFPNYNVQANAGSGYNFVTANFGTQFIKPGTFKVTDMTTGLVVCQDTNAFAYNLQAGNCTGTGVTGFVTYPTGAYQINFTTAPANLHPLVASWTNIMVPDTHSTLNRPQALDLFGDGTKTSGAFSSMFDTAPGGVSGHVFGGGQADAGIMTGDYAAGASGYTQAVSWLYGTKFPNVLPGESASTPFINMDYWRSEGMSGNVGGNTSWWRLNQWATDSTTKSTWTGYYHRGHA